MMHALYIAGLIWALAAYASAAYAGFRALHHAHHGPPARPLCLISDATRWLFSRSMSPRNWNDRDFLALGIFLTVAACVMRIIALLEIGSTFDFMKPPTGYQIRTLGIHIVSGSALIVLHCGVALHFQRRAAK